VLAFYDDYGRGMDGMQLPYLTRCFRATALGSPGADDGADHGADHGADSADEAGDQHTAPGKAAGTGRGVSDGTDTDLLLIDFR
jgi:hypothetical protein